MSRWLVVGSGGMLGQDVVATLTAEGRDVTGLTRQARRRPRGQTGRGGELRGVDRGG